MISTSTTAFLASCLAAGTLAYPAPIKSRGSYYYTAGAYVEDALNTAAIIPDILNDFQPMVNVSVQWAPNATASLGNIINPSDMLSAPSVYLNAFPNMLLGNATNQPKLTLVMTDPDAPLPQDPSLAQICHWIATGFDLSLAGPLTTASAWSASATRGDASSLTQVMPYINPQPPVNSTYHRYTLVALVPTNGTTEPLNLTVPDNRFRWGYPTGTLRPGVLEWADTNGLTVVGANFVHVRNNSYPGP